MHLALSGRMPSADVGELRPSACRHVGLDCTSCVKGCAQKVAALCGHLSPDQQRGVFLRLYPDPACHSSLPRFQKAYGQASLPPDPLPDCDPDFDLSLAVA